MFILYKYINTNTMLPQPCVTFYDVSDYMTTTYYHMSAFEPSLTKYFNLPNPPVTQSHPKSASKAACKNRHRHDLTCPTWWKTSASLMSLMSHLLKTIFWTQQQKQSPLESSWKRILHTMSHSSVGLFMSKNRIFNQPGMRESIIMTSRSENEHVQHCHIKISCR